MMRKSKMLFFAVMMTAAYLGGHAQQGDKMPCLLYPIAVTHLQSPYHSERRVELTIPARNCIFERPVDLHIRLDALSFNPNAFPALIRRNREHKPVVVSDLERRTSGEAARSRRTDDGGELFSFANWVSISEALVECSLTSTLTQW
jgi:hypothetical protein